jgi:pimeloyl-ACP methyl ester carboxylesterase
MMGALSTRPVGEVLAGLDSDARAGLLALFRGMHSGRGFVNDLRATPDVTAQIDQPTLVIATRTDGGVPFAQSRSLASRIRDAELIESHADSHMVWLGADWPVVSERMVAFLRDPS